MAAILIHSSYANSNYIRCITPTYVGWATQRHTPPDSYENYETYKGYLFSEIKHLKLIPNQNPSRILCIDIFSTIKTKESIINGVVVENSVSPQRL